jgi:nicotinamide mononucleotide transporter
VEGIWEFLFGVYKDYPTIDIVLETLGFVFGVASVVYSVRGNILVYPTGIISTGIYVYLLLKFGLYGDMSINAYYFGMSIYGWYFWSRGGNDEDKQIPISWASKKENLIGAGIGIASAVAIFFILDNFTDSTVPLIDAITTSLFFIGMWFMARKNVENWIYWIIGDLISIPLYHYKGLPLTSIQYVIFLVLAIMGFFAWKSKAKVVHVPQ